MWALIISTEFFLNRNISDLFKTLCRLFNYFFTLGSQFLNVNSQTRATI